MKYQFIRENSCLFRMSKMCQAFDVSPSGYYAWLIRPVSKREQENELLLKEIRLSHDASRKTYGSLRITADLNEKGLRCGKNKIARLMRKNSIVAKTKRKFKITTKSKHNMPVAANLVGVGSKIIISGINQVWFSDITYIPTQEGWLYLATVLDAYSRHIVGWAMSERINRELVISALEQAIGRRNPDIGLILHSDRGSQYASEDYQKLLKKNKFICSMSGKGNCYDNATMESFYGTLKKELVYFETYHTRKEARRSIFEYIEMLYNRTRRHSALGYKSPMIFESLVA
jgi:transposase InsO family protein